MKKIKISKSEGQEISITIAPSTLNSYLEEIDEIQAQEYNEAKYQINEGGSYEYIISEGYTLLEVPGIISTSPLNKQAGRITPNIYVGTLPIKILDTATQDIAVLRLEVRSVKSTYREDYRMMLEQIAEKCADLLMQHSSPVVQSFKPDLEKDAATAYQRFAFIKSIIDSEEFETAVHKVIASPTTKWKQSLADKPIQSVKRFNRSIVRQLSSSAHRINLADDHPLKKKFQSLPSKVQITTKEETVDTPENRFIKFALETFLRLCSDFSHLQNSNRVKEEASLLEEKLERYLGHSLFKDVSLLSSVPLNNPVLQRKEGYREIYRSWILFDLAAKLTWKGGEDVYEGNKRDVAVLYEYWLFFKLVDIVTKVFGLQPPKPEDLIEETSDGFGLKLRQGKYLPVKGMCEFKSRKLNVQLSYNRTYRGEQAYPGAGSWSRNMRPDYTITIWPFGISEEQAEVEELIVHIHFDAKYKVEKIQEVFALDVPLDEEKEEQKKGTYKRIDMLKMHAYKDAIRRTGGAYLLYPGDDNAAKRKGFHELIPGLGAFAIRPSGIDTGLSELELFLNEVLEHFLNRSTQREKISFRIYDTYKDGPNNQIVENIPEAFGTNRNFVPDETFILVAFYKDQEHLKWIMANNLYNARTGSAKGSLNLSPKETGARYLLLHSSGEAKRVSKIFKLTNEGPRIFSKANLIKKAYPNPTQEFYLIYSIEGEVEKELGNKQWDITKLNGYSDFRNSAVPFSASLSELMKVKI